MIFFLLRLRGRTRLILSFPVIAILGLIWLLPLRAEELKTPSAVELLSDVLAQMPTEPVNLRGDILCRKRHGVPLKELKFEMQMMLGEQNPSVTYTIRDVFGRHLETLIVSWKAEGKAAFQYRQGNPPADAPLPDMFRPIQGTDLAWIDMTLGFLRWTNGTVVGREEIKGRPCFVVLLEPSSEGEGFNVTTKRAPYAAVRVWIDEKFRCFLQAQGIDDKGRAVRTLWVRSVKKMGDRWMVKDMEVQSDPARRTKLTVREVNTTDVPEENISPEADDVVEVLQPQEVVH